VCKLSNSNNNEGLDKYYVDKNVNFNSIKGRAKLFSKVVEDHAIQCDSCNRVVIAEYNLGTRKISVFEHDPYISKDPRKVAHQHPAGEIMRKRIESRIAVEKRLLHSFDEGDFHVLTRTIRK
jgi:hypothetical protein